MAETKNPDPFPHLPRPTFYRENVTVEKDGTKLIRGRVKIDATKQFDRPPVETRAAKEGSKRRAAVDGNCSPEAARTSVRKRGRPVAPKPWEAEGISRATWNRRKKAKPA